ncbi:hypothetical protein [Polaribacter butkevichii]|nr:hypothetical protein [Polaribacter butkevichii]
MVTNTAPEVKGLENTDSKLSGRIGVLRIRKHTQKIYKSREGKP